MPRMSSISASHLGLLSTLCSPLFFQRENGAASVRETPPDSLRELEPFRFWKAVVAGLLFLLPQILLFSRSRLISLDAKPVALHFKFGDADLVCCTALKNVSQVHRISSHLGGQTVDWDPQDAICPGTSLGSST